MDTNNNFAEIRQELSDSQCVRQCAKRFGTTGDLTAMKICYLLRHYPELSVSDIAELTGISISAASRSLKKLKDVDVLSSRQEAQTVFYRLQDNDFTRAIAKQFAASP